MNPREKPGGRRREGEKGGIHTYLTREPIENISTCTGAFGV
jgi:hypothetical protein